MGNKISFSDSKRGTLADRKNLLERLTRSTDRAVIAETKNSEVRGRITRFIRAVESIRFSVKAKDAELWMDEWPAFLLSGRDPKPEPKPVADVVAPEVSDDDIDTQSE